MNTLKWFAAAVMLVCVSVLLLFTFLGFGQKHIETDELSASELIPELIPESVRDLPIQNIREINSIYFGAQLQLLNAQLQKASLIDGFPCDAGWISFKQSGELAECVLAEDIIIQGNLIPQKTEVMLLNEERTLYFLPEDTEIQGYLTMSSLSWLRIPVYFYPSGRLRGFFSPSNVVIQGIPCRRLNSGFLLRTPLAVDTSILLHENGNLRRCTLSGDAQIDGRIISAGSEISLSEDGDVTGLNDSWRRRMSSWVTGFFD
jgi:hypothetical protein